MREEHITISTDIPYSHILDHFIEVHIRQAIFSHDATK